MKIEFKLGKPFEANEAIYHQQYVLPFTIAGGTLISTVEFIDASQKSGGIEELTKHKILTELVALLQIELYGKIISNETTNKSTEDKRLFSGVQTDTDESESKTNRG